MNAIIGSGKQEEKISKMGAIAHEMFPKIDVLAFKGAFRYGVQQALREEGLKEWRYVAEQDAAIRRRFFEKILKGAFERLQKVGLSREQTESLFEKLRNENQHYIQ